MRTPLLNVYSDWQEKFRDIAERFPYQGITGPLLMSPEKGKYAKNKKLMVIGQEMDGWYAEAEKLEDQMDKYEAFNAGEREVMSPFWSMTRELEAMLGNEPYSCAWTNICKYDDHGKRLRGKEHEATQPIDLMLADEIKVLEPDVCVFFTSEAYDYRIKYIFEGIKYVPVHGWNLWHLAKLEHELLPEHTYRYYHPELWTGE